MIDYSKITDQELAQRVCNYYERLTKLMDKVSEYDKKSRHSQEEKDLIHEEYKAIKAQIREEAHDIKLKNNEHCRNTTAFRCYCDGIVEAAAYGLFQPFNSQINFEYYSNIEEARYRITKYISLLKWEKISKGSKDAIRETYGEVKK